MVEQLLLQAACASPEHWSRLQHLLAQTNEKDLPRILEDMCEQIDQSDFSLADWISALLSFDQWLSEQEVCIRPVATMFDYIHCCTLTISDTLPPPNLTQFTNDMLSQHGFAAVDL